MKNKMKIFFYVLCFHIFIFNNLLANEKFNFDITEIEIVENGNKFIGKKRGIITTDNGIELNANQFEYDKLKNILFAKGNVILKDTTNMSVIYTDNIIYYKNSEKIVTSAKSKLISDNIEIISNIFEYYKNNNTFVAKEKVEIKDKVNDVIIFAEHITYDKDKEEIFTNGKTKAEIEKKYTFFSKNIFFNKNKMELRSNFKSRIFDDKSNLYRSDKFLYIANEKLLKSINTHIVTNYNKVNSDNYYFKDGIFNFQSNNFVAKETEILLHNDIFKSERSRFLKVENEKLNLLYDDELKENNPRIVATSSKGNQDKTVLNKAIFTSCKKNDTCPAWSIKSSKIIHDKKKKQLIYDNSVLNLFNIPVFYFPKFFHPDPSVERQSGFLRPQLNNSKSLGTSFYLPYYHVISSNKDYTFKPSIFEKDILMLQNEYRQIDKYSSFVADFSYTKGYKSDLEGSNKNSITHLFSKFDLDLNLNSFNESYVKFNFEKVSNDNYLNVFQNNLADTKLKPSNNNMLKTSSEVYFENEKYDLSGGFTIYEDLTKINSDRYQYVFPYYNLSSSLSSKVTKGSLNFSSNGSTVLQNTNNIRTKIINNLEYLSNDYISNLGNLTRFGIYLKNINSLGKNDQLYKSSPQIEAMTLFEVNSALPFVKVKDGYLNTIEPKISFRISPNHMKNYSNESRTIEASNIFSINRLGLNDSLEAGRSLTLGTTFKTENIENIEKYFEATLATNLRDKKENDIPTKSSLNEKNSNFFGSIKSKLSDNISIGYNFETDNDLKTFEYNSINTELSFNNFITELSFIETNGSRGNTNVIDNKSSIKLNKNNYLIFNTRRNRELNLTEYYDLVYEYKNDCLTAGIKYKKTYYSNDALKPTEDLMFTVTLFPLTTLEQEVDNN